MTTPEGQAHTRSVPSGSLDDAASFSRVHVLLSQADVVRSAKLVTSGYASLVRATIANRDGFTPLIIEQNRDAARTRTGMHSSLSYDY